MILWLLLVTAVFNATLGLAALQANAKVSAFAKQTYKSEGLGVSAPVGCLIAVGAYASVGLWIAYGIQIHDWRIVAIVVVPWLIGLFGKA
ncbi:MAG TPA: hypothetical protein DGG94_11495, partial [Micromonosporaceae bacterium]|nr:hypothetical protein [Micromonosporaceae bacterium]